MKTKEITKKDELILLNESRKNLVELSDSIDNRAITNEYLAIYIKDPSLREAI